MSESRLPHDDNRGDIMAVENSSTEHQTTNSGSLSEDYAKLAQLFAQLDEQVGAFTANMDTLVQTAPAYSGLTTMWEEQAKSLSADTKKADHTASRTQSETAKDDEDAILGDEAENTDDPLVFV
jgi:hypothetical protein